MSRVITFSRVFPAHHPKAGQPTFFVEKIWASRGFPEHFRTLESLKNEAFNYFSKFKDVPKHHTIRQGRRWQVGQKFSPRVWSGKPYQSKQIIIGPDIEIVKTWDIDMIRNENGTINVTIAKSLDPRLNVVSANDGLSPEDFNDWFNTNPKFRKEKKFVGQIICWNHNVNY